ncbi:unnamed protein product [Rotaria sordida]|uniref:Uncharacterized protein n=1 Tax=Rotaria sordida TaxID=392033 RepID=A0A814TR14_9BILA|nr:unnamed protein product [Rotaria sordida]CAF4091403.1 unnamed protein product [Rotaria sordida]
MRMFRFFALLYLSSLIGTIDIINFIPFGIEYNDKIFEQELNNITDPILISIRYSFFNQYYDQIRISCHGLIILRNNSCLSSLKAPNQFSLQDLVYVTTYWIDTNITDDSISKIFYREILLKNKPNTLSQISETLRNGFFKLAAQRMFWAFVITWYQVRNSKNCTDQNTYQAMLTTNGFYSFILFTYHQLQWLENSSCIHLQIRFNTDDNIKYYKLKKSFSPAVISFVNDSNIGIPDQFVFHISGNFSDIQCITSTSLQISPFRDSIYSRYEFQLHDIKIKIELYDREDKILIDSTEFLAHVSEDHGELILSNYGNLTHQIVDPNNNELIFQLQSNVITCKYLFEIVIYDYIGQLSSDNKILYNHTQHRIDLGLDYFNLSSIGNNMICPVKTDPNDHVHALQISFKMKKIRQWFHSALLIGTKIFTAATSLYAAYCPAWLLMQGDPNQYIKQIPVCPCQVPSQPWLEEFMGFRIDEGCDGRKPIKETCHYHRKARSCYRKKSDRSWSGAQCCYDEQGKFIEHGKEGAGTLDVISPDGNGWFEKRLGMFGHLFSDFLSYWSCCRNSLTSEAMCKAYYHYRPAGRCENMTSELIEMHRNPYFVILNSMSYKFREQGEYILLSLPKPNGLEVQVRLTSNGDNNRTDSMIGIIAFVEAKKHIQFELFPMYQFLDIRIDTQLIKLPDEEFFVPMLIYEDEHMKIKCKVNGTFKIWFHGSHLRFRAHIRLTFDFFELEILLEQEKFKKLSIPSFGLLDDINGLMFPNGTKILINKSDENILFEYDQSWRISQNTSLFYYSFDNIDHRRPLSSDIGSNSLKRIFEETNNNVTLTQ